MMELFFFWVPPEVTRIFGNPWVAFPLSGLAFGTLTYALYAHFESRVINKIMVTRDEMIRLLDLMHVTTNARQITIIQLGSTVGIGAIFFLLLWPRVTLGLFVAIAVTGLLWGIPLRIVRRQWEQRCSLFVDQMVNGLTIMANGIKAGLSVTQCMERVVDTMPNPIAQEFQLVLAQIRLGRSVEEALIDLGERIPKPDVQMFVTAINILKETGGNLAETFSTIVVTIRERQKVEKKIEAMTAQGIMQGFIVSMVPIGLIALFYFIDPGYISPMFNSTLGIILLIIMMGLVIIGGIAIRRVVTIKV